MFEIIGSDRVALLSEEQRLTYTDLAVAVDSAVAQLGSSRRLLLLEVGNTIPSVVWFLAALKAGHPIVLVEAESQLAAQVRTKFDPDIEVDASGVGDAVITTHRTSSVHQLHPDLAVLLSTSGSTAAPKLVRLSHTNLTSNATAIATYLHLTSDDRAITTLPMQYCYGLSVLTSHLQAQGSIVLTPHSVVDHCFWEQFQEHRVTTLAGVPHTFDLLDAADFTERDLPSLRMVTQAGGKLASSTAKRYEQLSRNVGWDLFVMYGQTEATARMAYMPPNALVNNLEAVGQAIPGGSLTIDLKTNRGHVEENGSRAETVGELVYRGENVMMGYATSPGDFARGDEVKELRTGDLARLNENGFFEIVGRTSRFVKPFGLRIDLDRVEQMLGKHATEVAVTGDDSGLMVACVDWRHDKDVSETTADYCGLPKGSIQVLQTAEIPRLANNKVDYLGLRGLMVEARSSTPVPTPDDGNDQERLTASIAALYSSALISENIEFSDSFVSLGGDSLSYIEVSTGLERLIGHLPSDWPSASIAELGQVGKASSTRSRSSFWAHMETAVLLRAAAIIAIVATHIGLTAVPGGSHVLLGVAGYSFAAFTLRSDRKWGSIARIFVPAAAWQAGLVLFSDGYQVSNILGLHNWVGPSEWGVSWRFWFLDVLIQSIILASVLMMVPVVRRLEHRQPYWFAMGLLACGVLLRFSVEDFFDNARLGARTAMTLWAFAAGWAAFRAETWWHRMLISVAVCAAAYDFYPSENRVTIIIVGLLMVTWIATFVVPRFLVVPLGLIGKASLFIYLTHWFVYPGLIQAANGYVALLGSVVVGFWAWKAWTVSSTYLVRRGGRAWRSTRTLEAIPRTRAGLSMPLGRNWVRPRG